MSLQPKSVLDSKGRERTPGVAGSRPAGGYSDSAATVGGRPALANDFTSGSKGVGRPRRSPVTTGRRTSGRMRDTRTPMFQNVKRTIVP